MNRTRYLVTKLAGPKVAGLVKKAGETVDLTEAEARGELLSGAIVPMPDDGKTVEDPLKGSDGLADLQARARGLDKAPEAEVPQTRAEKKAAKAEAAKDGPKSDMPPGADTPPAA